MKNFFQPVGRLASDRRGRWYLLALIVAVGIFLRTYHFREWLYFYPDQARDALIAEDAITGKTDWPLIGPIAASTKFKIGPMYYYFQIIAGELFGVAPDTVAYPDLLFGILAIPLLFIFLKRYFDPSLALILTGLFSVSAYAIKYARFAWNPNPIPFFVLLFLLALLAFLEHREQVRWAWVLTLGIALGVGVQLHTVLLLLFPAMLLCVGGYLLLQQPALWKRFVVVCMVAVALNIGQIRYEVEHHYANTKVFLSIFTSTSEGSKSSLGTNALHTALSHSEGFIQIMSSLGDLDRLGFAEVFFPPALGKEYHGTAERVFVAPIALLGVALFLWWSWLLVRAFRREQDIRKREFLGLILLYGAVSFILFIPITRELTAPRYFIHLIFLPFVFLGLSFRFAAEWSRVWAIRLGWLVVVVLVLGNIATIRREAWAFAAGDRSNAQYVVLGEIEPMAEYIHEQFSGRTTIYFFAEGKYMQNYFKPMNYVLRPFGMELTRVKNVDVVPVGTPMLYLTDRDAAWMPVAMLPGFHQVACRSFGNVAWCRLESDVVK